jgi:hypothetical protein
VTPRTLLLHATLRSAAGKPRRLAILAYTGGVISPEGWGPTVIDLGGLTIPASLPILLDHKNETGAMIGGGVPRIEAGKLLLDVALADVSAARDVIALLESGAQLGASVGIRGMVTKLVRPGDSVLVNGKTCIADGDGLMVVLGGELFEVSVLPVAADTSSQVRIAARGRGCNAKDKYMRFDEWLRENRIDWSAATRVRRESLLAAAATDGVDLDATQHDELLAAGVSRATASAEDQRHETAASLLRARPDEADVIHSTLEQADAGNWTPDRLRSEVDLRGSRGQHIDTRPRSCSAPSRMVLQAAFALAGGDRSGAERIYGAEVAQAADDLGVRNWRDAARVVLTAAGVPVPRDHVQALRAAFQVSTYSIPNIVADAINKQVNDAYKAMVPTYRDVAKIIPTTNFHPVKLLRLAASGSYEKVPPGGQLAHGSLEDQKLEVAPDTRGRIISVDRRDLINDDMGILSGGLAEELARVGLNAVGDCTWAEFLDNASFFTEVRGNRLTGAGSALSVAAIADATVALRKAKDPAGKNAGVTPYALVVPPELESTARALLNSTTLQRYVTSGTDQQPMGSPVPPDLRLVVEPRLSDATIPGYSETAWYLLGLPRVGTLLVAFLNGKETPTIESENSFESLGIQLRAYHDFGAALGDYRGGVAADGSA